MKKLMLAIGVLGAVGVVMLRDAGAGRSPEARTSNTKGLSTKTPPEAAPRIERSPSLFEASEAQDDSPGPDLQARIEIVRNALPTVEAVRKSGEEEVAHRPPRQVIEGGLALGELAEYLTRHPSEYKSATLFYAECALDSALLPAARAICLKALTKRGPSEWAHGVAGAVERVPRSIAEISAQL
jgi:hypothetical protein